MLLTRCLALQESVRYQTEGSDSMSQMSSRMHPMKSDNKRRHMTNLNNNNLSVDEHTMRLAIIALIFKRQ